MSQKLIYLDYAATTPVDTRVANKMMKYLTFDGVFANPASRSHGFGWQAEEAVENARWQIAEAMGASSPLEIIFTSGATESDNLAIKGVARKFAKDVTKGTSKGHIITSQIEHKAVLDSCKQLEIEGFEVTYLQPQEKTGLILPEQVKQALKENTILVSLMMVNNEIGTITDVGSIGDITREAGVLFHVDAAQAFGKIEFNVSELNIDLMSVSAHKIYGPKGIGALYVRRSPEVRLIAEQHGGGHERGMRSGTLPTHQIVGMGEAFEIAKAEFIENNQRISLLKSKFWQGLHDVKSIHLNGDLQQSVPNIINIAFSCVECDSLMRLLKNLAISTGSACTSKAVEPSFVLKGIGQSDDLAYSSIRFSFGHQTTEEDINIALKQIHDSIDKLRDLSPVWKMNARC